jgi:4-diphosphocytidyl-2-C-methyl-D-erythritol kinase
MPTSETARAKVNLTLHVTGRRADGYHLLDSLVVFAATGDRLRATPDGTLRLAVEGPFAPGVPADATNLVLRAATLLQARRGVSAGAALVLDKRLPHGAGIGGGSSDAAAALRLLARRWRVAPLAPGEALELGADVPVCMTQPEPRRMRGIGERLDPVPPLPPAWLVLANPGVAVPTGAVFRAFDARHPEGLPPMAGVPGWPDASALAAWLRAQRNDLAPVVCDSVAPVVGRVIDALAGRPSCLAAGMSGSGSTCWGLFATAGQARHAARAIAAREPGWWVRAAALAGQRTRATT